MKYISISTAVFVLAFPVTIQLSSPGLEDAALNFTELAGKYRYKVEEHDLTTEDGYILKLFHIPGNKSKPVLLMHGILDSADTFIMRGRKSLAAALSGEGYDVWLGNVRGNKHSRRHQRLNPDTDPEFWNFSFHEMGLVDLRVFIDFILRQNAVNNLSLIGHSQGNTLFYILGSMKPEYNAKINVAIALGPVCYLNVENYRPPLSMVIRMGPMINQLLLAMNEEEIFGKTSLLMQFMNNVCARVGIGYRVCALGLFAPIGGEDLEELEPEFFYSLMAHYPTSTSRKNALHMVQVAMRKEFGQFDHGPEKNLEVYKSKTSPVYDLKNVTMKVALVVGRNDKMVPIENVVILKNNLPNVVSYHVMERKKFNHIDHIWGKNMDKYLFPHISKLLKEYS